MEQTKTKEKNREIDMLNGKIAGKLIMFALPLAFSTILQQLFNSADVAVVSDIYYSLSKHSTAYSDK